MPDTMPDSTSVVTPCEVLQTAAGRIEFAELGPRYGPPVLFLHGGHSSCRERLGVAPLVAAGFRVIVPSRPGYGRTPLAGFEQPEAAARLLASLIDALALPSVHVVAASAAGPTGITLAARYPERVRRFVLVSAVTRRWLHPGDRAYEAGRAIFRPSTGRIVWPLMHLLARLAPGLLARGMLGELTTTPPAQPSPDELARFRAMILEQRASSGFLGDLEHEVPAGLLEQVRAPSLVVHSRHDASVGLDHAEDAAARIPNARLRTVDNAWGHLLWIDDEAPALMEEIAAFLREE